MASDQAGEAERRARWVAEGGRGEGRALGVGVGEQETKRGAQRPAPWKLRGAWASTRGDQAMQVKPSHVFKMGMAVRKSEICQVGARKSGINVCVQVVL